MALYSAVIFMIVVSEKVTRDNHSYLVHVSTTPFIKYKKNKTKRFMYKKVKLIKKNRTIYYMDK